MTKETAMKILKELHGKSLFAERTALETLIPELKESEDERVKKRILLSLEKDLMATKNSGCDTQDLEQCIAWFEKQGTSAKLSEEEQNKFAKGVLSSCALSFIDYLDAHSYEGKMCVSNGECEDIENAFHNAMWDRLHRYYCKYIEKQDEQKPILDFKASNFYVSKVDGKIHDMTYNSTDKVELKFKIGDWIVNDYCMGRIIEITNDAYLLDTEQGIPFSCEHNVHLWTIQDAKDGDVLISQHGNPLIYNGNYTSLNIGAYCGITCDDNKFKVAEEKCHWTENVDIEPATKEQRDLLFQKMKEAGYEWDAEKKELKKIHVIDEGKAEMDYCFTKMMAGEKVSPAWSDEDENYLQSAENACEYQYGKNTSTILWLKSLKKRIG